MNEHYYILASTFVVGMLFGSFFYTLALRYADGRINKEPLRALFGRSRCPSCGRILSLIDLVPLIGFIASRGKCHSCGGTISWLYPISELCFGTLALFTVLHFGLNFSSFFLFLIMGTGITISVIDIKTTIIPLPLVASILLFTTNDINTGRNGDIVYGLLLIFFFFAIILLLFPGAFGGGDLWYASALGFCFGLEFSIVLLETSLLSGALFGLCYALVTKKGFRTKIPFAPFLTFGLIVTLFFGTKILLVYYDLIR